MISFVEKKVPDMARIAALLDQCAQVNMWANRGPLYGLLADSYSKHFNLNVDRSVTPCANGAIALEAMARILAMKAGRKLRWIGSAFSFQNLGRGYFAEVEFVDCDTAGLLDLAAVQALEPDSFDGLVVVNPFGLFRDFTPYIEFAQRTGKALLIDNAAGVDATIPDWPWQSFSLHHTKPYGMGEGGLALTPAKEAEALYALLNYGTVPDPANAWLNNGKISDIACAFHIDRLEKVENWAPRYKEQAARVHRIATDMGLAPVRPVSDAPPATSWVYLSDHPIPIERLSLTQHANFAKYYKPLASLPRTLALYDRLINIPTHPDVAKLTDQQLSDDIAALVCTK